MKKLIRIYSIVLLASTGVLASCDYFEKNNFSIHASSNVYYLDLDNQVKFSVADYHFNDYEGNISSLEIAYYVEEPNEVNASIQNGIFTASSLGKVNVKATIPEFDLVSENSVQIITRYSDSKISDNVQQVLDNRPIFGYSYDIGINPKEASDYSISGANGILRLDSIGQLEIYGIGAGTLQIKSGAGTTVFDGRYSVYNSILCTKIKEVLIEKAIISGMSSNVTNDMLTNIIELNLSGELINDPSASYGIKYLTKLKSIDLSYNHISDLSFVETLTTLETVNLSYNEIDKIDYIVENQNLKHLDLSHNNVSDLRKMQYIHEIEYLDLSHNEITDINYLSSIYSLKSLFLNNNKVVNFKDSLSGLSGLVELGVGYCGITFSDIRSLNYLKNLTYLDISGTDPSLDSVATLTKLTTLILRDCKLYAGKDLTLINSLSNLVKLDISENGIDDEKYGYGLDSSRLPEIEYLGIGGNDFISIPDLSGFDKLKELDVSNSYNLLSLAIIDSLDIETLILDECNSINTSDGGISYQASINNMLSLKRLSIVSGFNYMTERLFTFLKSKVDGGMEIRLFDGRWINSDTIENYSKSIYFTMDDLLSIGVQHIDSNNYTLKLVDASREVILSLVNDNSGQDTLPYRFYIPKEIFKVSVYGNKYRKYGISFHVNDRKESSITLDFHDFDDLAASGSGPIIKSAVGSKLIINSYGVTNLYSTEKMSNAKVNVNGQKGYNAIECYDIYLNNKDYKNDTSLLSIRGTNGGKGGNGDDNGKWEPGHGGDGGAGIRCHSLYILTTGIKVYGGKGGDGGKGAGGVVWARGADGGNGGQGGNAVEYSYAIFNESDLDISKSFIGGTGGTGGDISAYFGTPWGTPGKNGSSGASTKKI